MTQPKIRKPRRTYTDEFKNQLIQLYLNGKSKCDIVREYDISSSILNKQGPHTFQRDGILY